MKTFDKLGNPRTIYCFEQASSSGVLTLKQAGGHVIESDRNKWYFIPIKNQLKGPVFTCPTPKCIRNHLPARIEVNAVYHDVDTPVYKCTQALYDFESDVTQKYGIWPFIAGFEHLTSYLQKLGSSRETIIMGATSSSIYNDRYLPHKSSILKDGDIFSFLDANGFRSRTDKFLAHLNDSTFRVDGGQFHKNNSFTYVIYHDDRELDTAVFITFISGTDTCYIYDYPTYSNLASIKEIELRVCRDPLLDGEELMYHITASNIDDILEMCYCMPDILFLDHYFYGDELSFQMEIISENDISLPWDVWTVDRSYVGERLDELNLFDLIMSAFDGH